jgi:hypothetical protein
MTSNKVFVVILNWNSLAATLEQVRAFRLWRQIQVTLRVVDNGSEPSEVKQLQAELSEDELICSPLNLGFAGGNNLALHKLLQSDLIDQECALLLLNNDAQVTESALVTMLELLWADASLAAIGPVLKDIQPEKTVLVAGGYRLSERLDAHRLVGEMKNLPVPLITTVYVPGTVFLVKSQALKSVGLFDESYFFSGEVADWCERAAKQGFTFAIATTVMAIHDRRMQSSEIRNSLYWYYSLRNRLRFTQKHAPYHRRYYWYLYYIKVAAGQCYRKRNSTARATLLALWHGFTGQYGNQNHLFWLTI